MLNPYCRTICKLRSGHMILVELEKDRSGMLSQCCRVATKFMFTIVKPIKSVLCLQDHVLQLQPIPEGTGDEIISVVRSLTNSQKLVHNPSLETPGTMLSFIRHSVQPKRILNSFEFDISLSLLLFILAPLCDSISTMC